MSEIKHDLDHEVYIDPKDHKEHINHGMLEYTKEDLESAHAYYDEYHKGEEVESNDDVNQESGGLYIIADLCHFLTPKETYTKLNLIRDSFGRKGNHTTGR